MNGFFEFAMFAGAIIASIGLALGLEWLSVTGLFRLMPGPTSEAKNRAQSHVDSATAKQR